MKAPRSYPSTGHRAAQPTDISGCGWWQILKRVKRQIGADHVQIVSAGVAFYLFLALFPVLAAAVASYGLVTDPAEAARQMQGLQQALPADAYDVIDEMTQAIAAESEQTLGWGAVVSILLSLWSANKGAKALVTGLNIAYDEEDDRGFLRKIGITLSITFSTFIFGAFVLALIVGVPILSGELGLPPLLMVFIEVIRWPILAVLSMLLLAVVYRWAPARRPARWSWVSPGAVISTILWLAGSALFSFYIEKFGSMSQTYGPFAAVVTLMLWFFLTAFIVILGAEINSESELQTAKDTTRGPRRPMGEREAFHADHVIGDNGEIHPDS